MAVEIGFYAYLLWLGVVFYRVAKGRERVLVAGWFVPIFFRPIQSVVSMKTAAAIDYVKAFCIFVALLAAVDIFLKTFASDDPEVDDQASSE
jgi:hypothetical protein